MIDPDHAIRQAAFIHFTQLDRQFSEAVPWLAIQAGFLFHGECIYLGITQRGIHRPTQLQHSVLRIKNTKSKQRRIARSDDTIGSDDYFVYALQGRDPSNQHNTCLRDAFEDHTPLVNFYALIFGVYQILFSCYLMDWSQRALRSTLAVVSLYELGRSEIHETAHPIDRGYRTIEAKVRLHQAQFRELVLGAYGRRRVISRIPIPGLLDNAATRRPVTVYASRSCTHDAHNHNQLWIAPDVVIHVAEAVLEQHDGPTLDQATKGFHGQRIHLPRHTEDGPSRDYLAKRFEIFERKA